MSSPCLHMCSNLWYVFFMSCFRFRRVQNILTWKSWPCSRRVFANPAFPEVANPSNPQRWRLKLSPSVKQWWTMLSRYLKDITRYIKLDIVNLVDLCPVPHLVCLCPKVVADSASPSAKPVTTSRGNVNFTESSYLKSLLEKVRSKGNEKIYTKKTASQDTRLSAQEQAEHNQNSSPQTVREDESVCVPAQLDTTHHLQPELWNGQTDAVWNVEALYNSLPHHWGRVPHREHFPTSWKPPEVVVGMPFSRFQWLQNRHVELYMTWGLYVHIPTEIGSVLFCQDGNLQNELLSEPLCRSPQLLRE